MQLDFLRDKAQVLEQIVVLHVPYLPCLLPLCRQQWFFSICCDDSGTKSLLVFPLIAMMPPIQHVPMNLNTCKITNKKLAKSSRSRFSMFGVCHATKLTFSYRMWIQVGILVRERKRFWFFYFVCTASFGYYRPSISPYHHHHHHLQLIHWLHHRTHATSLIVDLIVML